MPREPHRLGAANTSPTGFIYHAPDSTEPEAASVETKPVTPPLPPRQPVDVYAVMGLTPDTVRGWRPRWSEARCRRWLVDNERRLVEILYSYLRQAVGAVLPPHTLRRDEERQYPGGIWTPGGIVPPTVEQPGHVTATWVDSVTHLMDAPPY